MEQVTDAGIAHPRGRSLRSTVEGALRLIILHEFMKYAKRLFARYAIIPVSGL